MVQSRRRRSPLAAASTALLASLASAAAAAALLASALPGAAAAPTLVTIAAAAKAANVPAGQGRADGRPALYNVNPDGTCGKPDDFVNILITGSSGSLANTQCSVTFTNFPDPTPPALCDGPIFGRPCTDFKGGLVITIGGFARRTDNPDVQGILSLLGLGGLTSVGGLFIDIADGARLASLGTLPKLATVSGAGLQILGARQVGAAPGLASLRAVDGQLFLVATQLASLADFSRLTRVSDSAILINNHNLTSMAGLEALASVGGQLVVSLNARLARLDGLEGLEEVGTDPAARGFVGLSVANNTRLTSVAGLAGLTRVGGTLQLANNPTLMSLAGLERVAEVGDAAGLNGASAGVAHAGVAVTGNTVLRNISALGTLGQCARPGGGGGGGGTRGRAKAAAPRPSVKVEVYVETGVKSAPPPPPAAPEPVPRARAHAAAARAAAAEGGGEEEEGGSRGGRAGEAGLPQMANDFEEGRVAGRPSHAASPAAAAADDTPPQKPAPRAADGAKPALAAGVPGLLSFAAQPAAGAATHPAPSVVASRAEAAAAAAAQAATAVGGGGGGAAPADAAAGLPGPGLAVQLQAREEEEAGGGGVGGLLSRLLPPAPWARSGAAAGQPASSRRQAGAGTADGGGRAPPGPRRPRLPPLPPLPTPPPALTPPPSAVPAGVDPLLVEAVAADPDTKCTFTSWEDVCAFIALSEKAAGGLLTSIGADHAWRAAGVCVGYAKPALPAQPSRPVTGLTIGGGR